MPTNPSGISERERQRRDRQRRLSRILREQEMLTYVGLKKSQVAEMIKRGEFPGPLKLSETGRAKASCLSYPVGTSLGTIVGSIPNIVSTQVLAPTRSWEQFVYGRSYQLPKQDRPRRPKKSAGNADVDAATDQLGSVAMVVSEREMDQGTVSTQRDFAKPDNSETWNTYEACIAAYDGGSFDGIGFCLLGSGFNVFDVDKCRDPETGELKVQAQKLLKRCGDTYAEVTVSGTGIRIIGLGHSSLIVRRSTTLGMAFPSRCIAALKGTIHHRQRQPASRSRGQLQNIDERNR